MSKTIYTVFDLETTGLNKPVGSDQVIEIAALRTDLERDLGALHMVVELTPGRTLSDFIKNLTGLTEPDLDGGFDSKDSIAMLADFIGDSVAVAHHYPFDSSFFRRVFPNKFICTRVLAKSVDMKQGINRSASLKDVCKAIGYDLSGHHQAGNDVRATKAVLAHYLPLAEQLGVPYLNILVENPDRPLDFIPPFAKVLN